jgi:cephalosporin hydroxylase
MEVLQHELELEELVQLYVERSPRSVLEIGVWDGGTLREWLRNNDYATVVALDDNHRSVENYDSWIGTNDLIAIQGKSQDPAIIANVRRHDPFGWIFVDADHTYPAVQADWDNYRGMVSPGGVFLFHDIIGSKGEMGVRDLWREIRLIYKTREIIHNIQGDWGGIGIVYL